MKIDNTFGDYKFDDWVCEEVRIQIISFWGCFGRTYKDWLKDTNIRNNEPNYGQFVCVIKRDGIVKGRYIHCWNNVGRLISDTGKVSFVSTCDTFLDKAPSAELYAIN